MIEFPPNAILRADPRCLEMKPIPGVFLRFESPREELALPYAELRSIAIDCCKETLVLSFVAHRVTLLGCNLGDIYQAASDAYARLVCVRKPDPNYHEHAAWVREIRIEPLEADGRRKR